MLFKKKGILGINARNLLYLRPYNKKKAIRLADSKLKTKHFLSARGIPVPRLYATIKSRKELKKFDFESLPFSFILKPDAGYGGEGILVIAEKKNDYFLTADGEKVSFDQFRNHLADILDGRFSITGLNDYAFFEQMIVSDERLARFAYRGLPDIRVVVHNLIPVMAMLRLPTKKSKGKANLHQGAVGVGIDLGTGEATYIVQGTKIIEEIPGIGKIKGFKIPYWKEILLIASKAQLLTNLGYLAADLAIDKNSGPVLLEINARAGLGVQIANLIPLRKRLERISGIRVRTSEKGVRIAEDMFGRKIERRIEHLSGKEVVGTFETVELILKGGTLKVLALISPGIECSLIDFDLAKKTKLLKEEPIEEEKTLKVKFGLKGKRIKTAAQLEDLSARDYKIVVGRRDLSDFLIDPIKKREEKKLPRTKSFSEEKTRLNFSMIDQKIAEIDQQIKLLFYLRPINLAEEKGKFFQDFSYNPQFIYPELKFDPFALKEQLKRIELFDSSLGLIFQEKKEEILKKIELIENIGTSKFTEKSLKLFGAPGEDLLEKALVKLKSKPRFFPPEDGVFKAEEVQTIFEEALEKARLFNWRVSLKEEMISDCVSGKRNILFVRKDARFSKERIKMLIAHEIETHLMTAENGKRQPYLIFNQGLAGYLTTQEGLAIYNQEKAIEKEVEKNYWPALSVLMVNYAFRHSFSEIFARVKKLGFSEERAFRVATKVKRGLRDTSQPGAFTKDFIYFQGYQEIKDFVEKGGDLKRLYFGKINLRNLEGVEKIPGLLPPRYLPESLK